MKSNVSYLVAGLAIAAVFMSGCSNSSSNDHKSAQSSASSTTTTAVKGTKNGRSKTTSSLWNSSKDEQLEDFINQLGTDHAPVLYQIQ